MALALDLGSVPKAISLYYRTEKNRVGARRKGHMEEGQRASRWR